MKSYLTKRLCVTPIILFALFIFTTTTVAAGETVITNSISASSNSGGNSAEAGEVVRGEAKNSVHIETIIDGDVVSDIYEESFEPIVIKEVISDANDAEIKTEAFAGEKFELTETKETAPEEVVEKKEETEEKKSVLEYISNLLTYVFSFFRT